MLLAKLASKSDLSTAVSNSVLTNGELSSWMDPVIVTMYDVFELTTGSGKGSGAGSGSGAPGASISISCESESESESSSSSFESGSGKSKMSSSSGFCTWSILMLMSETSQLLGYPNPAP